MEKTNKNKNPLPKIEGFQLRVIWPQDRQEHWQWPHDTKWAYQLTETFFGSYTRRLDDIKTDHPKKLLNMRLGEFITLKNVPIYRESIHGIILRFNGSYEILKEHERPLKMYDGKSNNEGNLQSKLYLISPLMQLDSGGLPDNFSMDNLDYYIVRECVSNTNSNLKDIAKVLCRGDFKKRFDATPQYILKRMQYLGIFLEKPDYSKSLTLFDN